MKMRLSTYALIVVLGIAGQLFATAAQTAQVSVLSSRADTVSGGDALVRVTLSTGVTSSQARVTLNGVDVSRKFVASDGQTLLGLVDGLRNGANTLQINAGTTAPRQGSPPSSTT